MCFKFSVDCVAKSENKNAIAIKDRTGDVDWIIDEIVKMWTNQSKAVWQCISLVKLPLL